jgi:hypothetical protein
MTLRISLAPKDAEDVLNLPEVVTHHWPDQRDEPFDITPLLLAGGFSVVEDGVAFIFNSVLPNIYEVHTAIANRRRGPNTKRLARECVDVVFSQTDAFELVTRVPEYNTSARALAEAAGFKERWVNPRGWGGKPIATLSLPISVWASRTDAFKSISQQALASCKQIGVAEELFDDSNFWKYLGVTLALLLNEQGPKAQWFYTLWGATYGAPSLEILGPDLIQLGGTQLLVNTSGALELG